MAPSPESARLSRPGFGLALDHPVKDALPYLLQDTADDKRRILTVRERTMMRVMDQLSDKPQWQDKVFDDMINDKWRAELVVNDSLDMSDKMFDWVCDDRLDVVNIEVCMKELRHKAKLFERTGAICVYDGGVCKSDFLISPELSERLRKACRPLEDVPSHLKDWHPGSDGKVLDLVHPSLFPLVYGRSRAIPDEVVSLNDCTEKIGHGEIIPVPDGPKDHIWSLKYQWLPSEVAFCRDSDSVKISSYINNLLPETHQDLYTVIEQVLGKAIDMWDWTLQYLSTSPEPARIEVDSFDFVREDEENAPEQGEDEDEDDFWQRRDDWEKQHRTLIMPEPGDIQTWLEEQPGGAYNLRSRFKDQGLQVIVKLANIHLTPAKPEYDGGTWHVEGQANERICASALYYYDCENITESRLGFRQDTDGFIEASYEQDDHEGPETVFGFENEDPATQDIGDVVTREGRLITFPNVLQHRVHPFRLADASKPGHRKILAFFLVDPHRRVLSTANVPPQQKAWWANEIKDASRLAALPKEMLRQILDVEIDFPLSMEQAKEHRLELMEERKYL
ncbi:MAG: hypothetical protein M1817_002494 [Caeruleum heppii]|nr:MAG: hypothetical protein M1817_002494 [Caeruleum heppii]